jgi:hypothetical protein
MMTRALLVQLHDGVNCQCRPQCGWSNGKALLPTGATIYDGKGRAVVATEGPRLGGIFRYRMRGKKLCSYGTFVMPRCRQAGLAAFMWEMALDYEQPREIEVHLVSDRGLTLVNSLQLKYPRIYWDVHECGDRLLRVLPK